MRSWSAAAVTISEPAGELRRARVAISAIFLIHGLLVASWVSRIPAVQAALHLSKSELGLVLLAIAAGSMVSMPFSGWCAGVYGSRRTTLVTSLALCACLVLPGLARNAVELAAALALFGASAGAMDVAMNVQAVELENEYDKPVMASFHALFSLGGMLGSMAGGAAAAYALPPLLHFACSSAALAFATCIASVWLLHTVPHGHGQQLPAFRFTRALAVLTVLAFCVLLNEGAMADWTSVYLRSSLRTSEAVAAYGYAVFSATMAAGRFIGDWLTVRVGRTELVRYGAAIAGAGLGIALWIGNVPAALAGFAAAGAGFATIIPLVFAAAGRAHGSSPGAGMATVTTVGYLGFLTGPPLIGYLADLSSLRIALVLPVVLSLVASSLAGAVRIGER